MATIKTVEEFLNQLKAGHLSWPQVSQYVEIDPDAPVIRLRIRPGVLPGPMPEGLVVDQLVYEIDQEQQAQKRARRVRALSKLPAVIADGDSWFHLPPILRPVAIADRIGDDGKFDMNNLAHWGDTLKKRIEEKKYLRALANGRADWLILSGGGNDVQISLATHEFLYPYDPARPLEQAITAAGLRLLEGITSGYTTIFTEVGNAYRDVRILCYAYDYPKPTATHCEYIGKHLQALRYPIDVWHPVIEAIMHHLAAAIMSAVAKHPGAIYLDSFGVAQPYPWFDDMHPNTDGFKALARWFEARMSRATRTFAVKKKRQSETLVPKTTRTTKLKKPGRRSK